MAPMNDAESKRRESQLVELLDRTFAEERLRPFLWGDSPLAGALDALGDRAHAVQISIYSPTEYSVMLAVLGSADRLALSPRSEAADDTLNSDGNKEIDAEDMKRRRLFFMDAREELRLALHPQSEMNLDGDSPARSALKKAVAAFSENDGAWGEFSAVLSSGADRPRAFGAEVFEFDEAGEIVAVHDGRGRVEDYYRLA